MPPQAFTLNALANRCKAHNRLPKNVRGACHMACDNVRSRKIQLIRLGCLVLLKGAGALAQDGGSGCVGEVDDGRRLQRHGAGVDGQCYARRSASSVRRKAQASCMIGLGMCRCRRQGQMSPASAMLQAPKPEPGNGRASGGNADTKRCGRSLNAFVGA